MDPSWYEVEEFCAAAKRNDIPAMKSVLDAQGPAIVHARDSAGDTALSWAAWYGNIEAVEWLLNNGADINMPGVRNRTPMGWAAEGGRKETIALLLERGADPSLKDDEGNTPAMTARIRNFPDVVALIEGKVAERLAAETAKKNEEEGKALSAKRLEDLKKHKPPRIKGF